MLSTLTNQLLTVTENAALACDPLTGRGDKMQADKLATESMRETFNNLDISGKIVIGEGERDSAPMLFIGEEVGKGGMEIDIAVDPLEGTNLCANNQQGAITVIGVGPKGTLMHAPDTYMDKIIVGVEVKEKVSLDYPVKKNIQIIAQSFNMPVSDVTVMVLKRKRNQKCIQEILDAGARVRLIGDGDVCAGINALLSSLSNVHALMGIGAAPEGVIGACSARCLDGQMEGRFMPYDEDMEVLQDDIVARMKDMGIDDINRTYQADELAKGDDILFLATGVTTGDILGGVKRRNLYFQTDSFILSLQDRKLHRVQTKHLRGQKLS